MSDTRPLVTVNWPVGRGLSDQFSTPETLRFIVAASNAASVRPCAAERTAVHPSIVPMTIEHRPDIPRFSRDIDGRMHQNVVTARGINRPRDCPELSSAERMWRSLAGVDDAGWSCWGIVSAWSNW